MAFVPIANTCAVEIRLQLASQQICNTLGFHKATGIGGTDLIDLADFLATSFWPAYRTQLPSSCTLREIYARDLTSESGDSATSLINAGQGGSVSTGNTLPMNVTWCVSFRSALRGRANRGRNYWPALRSGQYSPANDITTAVANAIVVIYQRLLPGGSSDPTPWRWVVMSRQLNGVTQGRAVPITAVVYTSTTLDSMRRRLPGRGL